MGRIALGLSPNLLQKSIPVERQRTIARDLVDTFISLGPTFIKIGQTLSTRIDLLPEAYIEAFTELQDKVPAFPPELAVAIVERELQKPLKQLFQRFDIVPIAAASLGQVHRARLMDGTEVVVKIQRPALAELFNVDRQILRDLVNLGDQWVKILRKYRIGDINEEFFDFLMKEIDYQQEARNIERFRANFERNLEVTAPQVYWRYTTKRVLTMSYLPGIKVSDRAALEAAGFDPQRINQIGVCCYLKQLLLDGFFQADPHPGNMAVTADGRLAIYDFGMMAELQSLAREETIGIFGAIVRKDPDAAAMGLINMGLIEPNSDLRPVRKMLKFMLDRFTDRPIDVREFAEIRKEISRTITGEYWRITPEMTFVIKALSMLDGIARSLDPNYNLIGAARPFITDMAKSNKKAIAVGLSKQATAYFKQRWQQPQRMVDAIESVQERLELEIAERRDRDLAVDRERRHLYAAFASLTYLLLAILFALGATAATIIKSPTYAIVLGIFSSLGLLCWFASIVTLLLRTKLDRWNG